MGARALRGIHASGFALDRPLAGLADLPPSFRDLLIDARFRAAERVFGTAIARGADLVLLAGGILSPASGPGSRGPWFLLEQFRRLAEHGIDVIWAEESHDVQTWIRSVAPLPGNVTLLSGEATALISAGKSQERVALHCRSAGSGIPADKGTAAWHLVLAPSMTVDSGLTRWADYVALAGPIRTLLSESAIASGAPQGTGFAEPGAHGCLSFELAPGSAPKTEFIATDVIRWIDETHSVSADSTYDSLRSELAHRLREFPAGHSCDGWVVRWRLDLSAAASLDLARHDRHQQLLADLRREALESDLTAWPAAVSLSQTAPVATRRPAALQSVEHAVWTAFEATSSACRGAVSGNQPVSAIDLADLLGDEVRSVPAAMRLVPADGSRHDLDSLLCAQAARTLAAHSLTALR